MTRVYRDRLRRAITDPRTIEARFIQQHLRRLITRGMKAGRKWNAAVTVGDLAVATKLTSERVVAVIRDFDMWPWGVAVKEPVENSVVFEDGE